MTRGHTSGTRRARQLLVGLAALLILALLVVGVPIVLAKLAPDPLPRTVPNFTAIRHALTTRDQGQLFLRALTVVAWPAWAVFALSVLIEIPAAIRRRPALHLPGLGLPQRAAATLIASVTLMMHSPVIASAAAQPVATTDRPTVAAAATTPVSSGPTANTRSMTVAAALNTAASKRVAANTSTAPPVYEVRHGDWLGYIAERYLGDFDRYHEIADLNPGLEAHDHRFPDHIEDTWRLVLPADAHDRGTRPHATGNLVSPPATDNEPHRSTPQPTTPGPAPQTSTAPDSPTPAPAASTAPSAATRVPSAPASAAATKPAHASSAPVARSSTPAAEPSSNAPRADPPATSSAPSNGHQPAEDDSMLDRLFLIGVPLVGAGLLATLVLTTLRRRRRRQEQHRPVGRRIPDPVKPEVETQARAVSQPLAVERLDHALRALAAALVQRPAEQMPDIVGAWLDGDTVNLLLTAPCPHPPAPWIGDHLSWTLPATTELPDVDGQLAPLPTLVAVGSQPGTHLLLDLERLGLLAITGDTARAGDLLRYFAAELALNSWSDYVEVTVAGFDADETSALIALSADRVDSAPNIAAAIERIRRRASQVVQSLDHLGASDPLTGRIADIAADAWMPQVLLAKDPNAEEIAALEALDNDLAATGRCAVAVAVTTSQNTGRWPVSIDETGRLTIAFLGMTGEDADLTAAGLPRTELGNLSELLTSARQGTPAAGRDGEPALDQPEDWPAVPPAPEPEAWARGTDASGGLLTDLLDAPATTDTDEPPEHQDPSDDEAPDPDEGDAAETTDPGEQEDGIPVPDAAPPHDADDARVPAVVASAGRQAPARKRITTPVRRRHSDPALDADLRAWTDADPDRPRVAILGPVTVEAPGQPPSERLRFYAEIIVYLTVRGARGATTDQFDEAMWPGQPVKAASRRVAVARARRWLGDNSDGDAWLPDATADRRYRVRDGVLLDWHLFRRLRSRGESRGPAGASDLQQALALVRGAPLAGADIAYSTAARNPYVWLPTSEIQPHHLASAVVDTAHRLVELCLDGGDVVGARWAVDQAWLADPDRSSDIAWRDLLRVAAAEGNAAELDQLLGDLMRARDAEVPEDLDRETYRLLCELMPEQMRAGVR
jgi:hypothetical protein